MLYVLIAVLATAIALGLLWLAILRRRLAHRGLCRIDINAGEKRFRARRGETLLDALKSQGVFLPSACGGRGACGFCRCKIRRGGGELSPAERRRLREEEIQDHVRLACQVPLRENLTIEVPPHLLAITKYRGVVERIRDLTHDMKELRIRLLEPKAISFLPGQYVQLETPPYGKGMQATMRAYSISSTPQEKEHIELIIRLVPGGICTTWVFTVLKEGDEVAFTGPFGSFHLSRGETEMIWVAGGSGMAPFWGILRHMKQKSIRRKCTYFFGSLDRRDLVFFDELRQLEKELDWFEFVPALSSPDADGRWQGERGLITQVLDRRIRQGTAAEAYLCGSGGMIDAAIRVLNAKGMEDERIFYDKFT